MPSKAVLIIGFALVVIVGVFLFLGGGLGGTDTSSLDLANPTEAQIHEIARLLLDEDGQIQKRADEKLFKLGEKAVPVLKQFALEGYAQSHKALSLINDISPDEVFGLAEQLLENETVSVRAQAVSFVQRYKTDRRAIEVWVKALGNSETDVRAEAAMFLRNTPRAVRALAIEGLMKLKTDPEEEVRENAAESLEQLTGRDHTEQFNVQ